MAQHYSNPARASDLHALPNIETFRVDPRDWLDFRPVDEEGEPLAAGWYWWACMPGCLPDSPPFGPFYCEAAALRDAREGIEG